MYEKVIKQNYTYVTGSQKKLSLVNKFFSTCTKISAKWVKTVPVYFSKENTQKLAIQYRLKGNRCHLLMLSAMLKPLKSALAYKVDRKVNISVLLKLFLLIFHFKQNYLHPTIVVSEKS